MTGYTCRKESIVRGMGLQLERGVISLKNLYVIGSLIIVASVIWFVYNVFFIEEGDVVFVSESPTGDYTVFVSEKNRLFSKEPKYVAAYVEKGEDDREIFYYSPDAINGTASVAWKNRDTIVIAGHELTLPLDRYHHLIR